MNTLSVIKRRIKDGKKKIAVAAVSAGAATLIAANSFASSSGNLSTETKDAISGAVANGSVDYQFAFGVLVAAIVGFWALRQLFGLFGRRG